MCALLHGRTGYTRLVGRTAIILSLALLSCSSPTATPDAAVPPRPPLPDTPLLRLIKRAIADCEVSDSGSFDKCQDGYRYYDGIGELEWEDLHAALALECRLLSEPEPELARLALARLSTTTGALKRGGRIAEVADEALLACLRDRVAAPGSLNEYLLVGIYTQFAVGIGRDDEILAHLAGLTDRDLRRVGYNSLWKFAGMRLWPTLQRLVAEADDETAVAVINSIGDDEVTDDEQKILCTAFAAWLDDPRPRVQESAASHIGYSCARYHPQLLARVRAQLARGGMNDDLLLPVSHLAEECVEVGSETCDEAADLLEAIALSSTARVDARKFSLHAVGRRDRKRGRELALRLRSDAERGVAESAAYLLSQ
jgi:hypothetical protein